ncbi:cyclophilin B [Pelomyxa schiedti]|nr:cyclophilin B [Pelomyxa schiedti]
MLRVSPSNSPTSTPIPSPMSTPVSPITPAMVPSNSSSSLETFRSHSRGSSTFSGVSRSTSDSHGSCGGSSSYSFSFSSSSSSSSSSAQRRGTNRPIPQYRSSVNLVPHPITATASSSMLLPASLVALRQAPLKRSNSQSANIFISNAMTNIANASFRAGTTPTPGSLATQPSPHTPTGRVPLAPPIHLALPSTKLHSLNTFHSPPIRLSTLPGSRNPSAHSHHRHSHTHHNHSHKARRQAKLKNSDVLDGKAHKTIELENLSTIPSKPVTTPAATTPIAPTPTPTPQPSTTTTTTSTTASVTMESALKSSVSTPNAHCTASPALQHIVSEPIHHIHSDHTEQPSAPSIWESARRDTFITPTERARGLTLIASASSPAVNGVIPNAEKILHAIRRVEEEVFKLGNHKDKLRAELLETELQESKRLALLLSMKEDLRRTSEIANKQIPPSLGLSFLTSMTESFFHLIDALPPDFVTKHTSSEIHSIQNSGSEDILLKISNIFSAQAVSTYPYDQAAKKRLGNPVCDHFHAKLCSGGRAFLCITDGCNWGVKPKEAACRASSTFINFLFEKSFGVSSVQEYGALMIQALAHAHNSIVWDKRDIVEVGTTTLLGVTCVPTRVEWQSDPHESVKYSKWACIVLSIGDCKAFRWSAKEKKVYEITAGNRGTLDPSDPGGRIGPFLGGGAPDLRNLCLYHTPCNKNDIIVLVSDGVHDNLEAPALAVDPGTLVPEFVDKSWDEATALNPEKASRAREEFMTKKLAELVSPDLEQPLVHEVVERIISYCMNITSPSRTFLEKNPRGRLPHDFKTYPGKLDHTTCLALSLQPSWV